MSNPNNSNSDHAQKLIKINVNGKDYEVEDGKSVFETCKKLGIYIPHLCYHPDIPPFGKCGLCVVEVDGNSIVYSCLHRVAPNMTINTNSNNIMDIARRNFDEFMDMSIYPHSKDIEDIFQYFSPKEDNNDTEPQNFERHNDKSYSIQFDSSKCINCDRCIRMCIDVQGICALLEASKKFSDNQCISCGQCITVCPTRALDFTSSSHSVMKAIASKFGVKNTSAFTSSLKKAQQNKKICILQVAPAVRVSVGELFGEYPGTVVTGKIVSAAKQLGFDYVFDTCFGADVTSIEEGEEFLERLTTNGTLPLFTSCCPAWVNFVEKLHPELMSNLSSTKSPHMILGTLIKTYFAQRLNVNHEDLYVVSLMPCVAKKMEIKRMQLKGDVDAVIIPQEFHDMIQLVNINWHSLKLMEFDSILGESSGAGNIFGASGGVTESVVRYVHEKLTGRKLLDHLQYSKWRGNESLKKAELSFDIPEIKGQKAQTIHLKIAVCNGIKAAKQLIETGQHTEFQLIEVMACKGGCINGGGQPRKNYKKLNVEYAKLRANSIFSIDEEKNQKTAGGNTEVQLLYQDFLGNPGQHILHTHYEHQDTVYMSNMRNSSFHLGATTTPSIKDTLNHLSLSSKLTTTSALQTLQSSLAGSQMSSFSNFSMGGSLLGNTANFQVKKMIDTFVHGFSHKTNPVSIAEVLANKTVVFVINSSDPTEMPNDAINFFTDLENSYDDLSEVKFAVCEFINKKTSQSGLIGRQIDMVMEHHLGSQITPYREIDMSVSDFGQAVFERWSMALCFILGIEPPKLETSVMYKIAKSRDKSIIEYPLRPKKFSLAKFKKMNKLDDNLIQISIKLSKGTLCTEGDYISILPKNPKKYVDAAITYLQYDPNDVYKIKSVDHSSFIPEIVSIKQLFEQYLNLSCPPNRELIKSFAEIAKEEGKSLLNAALDNLNNGEEGQKQKKSNDGINNIVDFFEAYAQYGVPPLEKIITCCPKIQPRTFSIMKFTGQVATIIGLKNLFTVKSKNNEDIVREGLCSSFISEYSEVFARNDEDAISELPKVAVKVKVGMLKYPESPATPLILIACGLGASSILMNLNHREQIMKGKNDKFGDAIVFFLNDGSDGYKCIENEFKSYKEKNVINDISIVHSSNGHNSKDEVTQLLIDTLNQHSEIIWSLWKEATTAVLFSASGLNNPEQKLNDSLVAITIKEGGLRDEEAMAYTSRHQVDIEIIQ